MSEADIVYAAVLKQIKTPRLKSTYNIDASAVSLASAPIPFVSTEALMDRLQGFVTVYNETLAHRLLQEGKIEEAKKALDRNPSLYRVVDMEGDTVLHIACRDDKLEFVRWLIMSATKKGGFYSEEGGEPLFDPNARNYARWTPLHCAAAGFHFKICDLLLREAPVSVNCITDQSKSPLHFLARYQDANEILSSGIVPDTAILSTSSSHSSSYLKQLGSSGASSRDSISYSSSTTVASATASSGVLKDLIDVLTSLLDAGADLSARDAKGETPLHVAASLGSTLVAEWLILNRADVSATSFTTLEMPLHVAVRGKNAVIVELLLGASADVVAPSKHGDPLELAQQYSSPEITKLLKDHIRALPLNTDHSDTSSLSDTPTATFASSVSSSPGAAVTGWPSTTGVTPTSPRRLQTSRDGGSSNDSPSGSPAHGQSNSASNNNITGNSTTNRPTMTTSASIVPQEHPLLGPSPTPSPAPQPPASTSIPIGSNSQRDTIGESEANSDGSFSPLQSLAATLPAIAALPLLPFRQLRRVVEAAIFSPGRSPLHEAVISNNERMVIEILRSRPALANSKDQQKWTPALYAAAYGHIKLLSRLARAGADLTCIDADESGILHFLARNRKVAQYPLELADLLDQLQQTGINLDHSNMFGATALHDAACRNNLVFVHLVCQRGAKVDATTKSGETPLIYAARENCVDAVNFLLHRGANMDHAGKNGSAVDVARNHCNVSVLKVFLFYKASTSYLLQDRSTIGALGTPGQREKASQNSSSPPSTSTSSTTTTPSNGKPPSIPSDPPPVVPASPRVDNDSHPSTPGFSVALSSPATSVTIPPKIFSSGSSAGSSSSPAATNSVGRSFKLRSIPQVEPFDRTTAVSGFSPSNPSPTTAPVVAYQDSPSSGKFPPVSSPSPPGSSSATSMGHQSNNTPPRMRSKSETPHQHQIQQAIQNRATPQTPPIRPRPISRTGSSPRGTSSDTSGGADLVIDLDENTNNGDRPLSPNFSSYLSPRRHLTVTINGAVIDYNQVYNVQDPLLAVFPCSCTINSPIAVFKEVEGFVIVWQRYIAFGHVTTTSSGALVADYSFNWKVPFASVTALSLAKSMFGSPKVAIAARPEGVSEDAPSTINISLTRCERLEALEKLLQYLFQNRTSSDRLEIDGVPITDMVGSILYPKENAEFHRYCKGATASETVLDHFSCYHKEEGAFASKTVYVSQHRLCFGKKSSWTELLLEDIKTMRKTDGKTIILETPTQKYTFSSIANIDAAFSLVESVWNAQQSDNRVVLFGALGRRTTQLCELFLEKFVKVASGPDSFYVRWVLISGYHVLDKRQQEMLRDIGVEVVWISSKSGFLAIPDVLQYMRKIVLFYLDFDPKFLEVSEMMLRHCKANKQLKSLTLVTLSLGDFSGYMAESIALLQDSIKETEVGFIFLHCHPAFMQILEDEFVDIKRDWRFQLPWDGATPKLAWLDMRDVVDVAVQIVTAVDSTPYLNKDYYLAGPAPLSCDEIATVITQLSEHEVRFIGITMEELKRILLQSLTEVTSGTRSPDSSQQSLSRTVSMEQYLPAIVTHDMTEVLSFASNTNSTIMKALRSKFSVFEQKDPNAVGLDFDTQQYLTVFSDLASYSLHAITSMITLDLTGNRPRSIHNFVVDHLSSFRSKGAYNLTLPQKDAAVRHFTDITVALAQTNTTRTDLANFPKIISPLISSNCPSFVSRLTNLYNPNGRSMLGVNDFVKTCGLLVNGDAMDQLSLSCTLFDSDGDGLISSQDIADVGSEIATILSAIGLEYRAFSIRSLYSAKGLASYPREAPLPQPTYSSVGVSLASIERPLRMTLSQAEFCHVLKVNRSAMASLGCIPQPGPGSYRAPMSESGGNSNNNSGHVSPRDRIALKVRRKGIYVWPGHPLWETTLRLGAGISRAVQALLTQGTSQISDISEADCSAEVEYKVSGASEPEVWTFQEYGGAVFRKVRELSRVSCYDYIGSLGIEVILGNLVTGRLANFEEISSTGRSGSFFLRTHDNKFIVKSLPVDEHIFLRKNLWRYYRHLMEYPNSLLSRFYGLYRVKSASGKQDVHFVVMANLFDTPLEIHEQYDLKGSTVNRYVADKMPFWSPNIAMKDLDFHRILHIGPERKAAFLQQAEIDAIFMESFNICDYSLLVGFHYSDSASSEPPNGVLRSSSPHPLGSFGAMGSSPLSHDDYTTYYLCNLIDILTQYNLKKRGESAIKSIVHKKSQISAISPNPYRKRFIRFLISIIQ